VRVFYVLLVSLVLISCGEKEDYSTSLLTHDVVKEKVVVVGPNSIVRSNGNDYVLYAEGNNLILSKDQYTTTLEDTFAKRYWLNVTGNNIYVFWWVKFDSKEKNGSSLGGKALYVRASQDGGKTFTKTVQINKSHGVLPDVHIVADKKGNVAVAYLDERNPGHQIYSSASSDGGKTWLEKDIQLNLPSPDADDITLVNGKPLTKAVTPKLQKQGANIVAMWEQIESFKGKSAVRFMSRSSSDFGKTWGEMEVIYTSSDRLSVELESIAIEGSVYLMAVLPQGLTLFVKKHNEKWQQVKDVAPRSDSAVVVSYLKTAYDKKYLYISYIYVEADGGNNWHTELVRLNLLSDQWEKEHYRFDKIADASLGKGRGSYQDIAILDDGTIVVVWEDYRGILPAIFMNYSEDKGQSWQANPIPLVNMGRSNFRQPFIKVDKSDFSVYFSETPLKDQTRPVARTRKVTIVAPQRLQSRQYSYPVQKGLKKRMDELMKLRISANDKPLEYYPKEWNYIDPIYRANVRKISWMKTRDLFRYLDYTIDEVVFSGAIAYVKGSMNFNLINDLPEADPKQKYLLKDKKQKYTAKWGWFYDNWYIIPEDPSRSHLP
jgi:photosystem II stability/assembly factor-like uncharacterized protein